MKFKVVIVALLVFGGIFASHAVSQEGGAPDMQKMMEIHKKATTPGPAHKALEAFIGEWKTTMTVWMGGPESPATTIEAGISTNEWLMDGRWLKLETKAEKIDNPMMAAFMPTHSVALLGYDNIKKKYVYTVVDNASTQMLRTLGVPERDGSAIVFYGEIDEPMMSEYDKPVKAAIRFKGKDKIVMEIYDLGMGEKNNKVVETVWTRIKPSK